MHLIDGPLQITPGLERYPRIARCLMLYDWQAKISSEWLSVAESILRKVGLEPAEGNGTFGQEKSYGSYKRIRKRLAGFLDEAAKGGARPNIKINAAPVEDGEGFFPFRAEVVLNAASPALVSVLVALDETLVKDGEELLATCGKEIFGYLGHAYGCVWDFPCAFGPDAYLATMIAIPSGMHSQALRSYGARLTRWRDRRWAGLRPGSGYLREVYPINFVLDGHLSAPMGEQSLAEFMRMTGSLQPSSFDSRVYRWDVSAGNLDRVRAQLEDSGLILSAPHEPLQLPFVRNV